MARSPPSLVGWAWRRASAPNPRYPPHAAVSEIAKWGERAPLALYFYNAEENTRSGKTPSELAYGEKRSAGLQKNLRIAQTAATGARPRTEQTTRRILRQRRWLANESKTEREQRRSRRRLTRKTKNSTIRAIRRPGRKSPRALSRRERTRVRPGRHQQATCFRSGMVRLRL